MADKDNRFEVIHKEGGAFSSVRQILLDRDTGVQYLMVSSGYGIALTPLLDKDGKPMVEDRYKL